MGLTEEMKTLAVHGKLPCAMAFKIAEKLKLAPRTVGEAANELRVRIINCQLGCFYVEKATHEDLAGISIGPQLVEGVWASSIDGKLPCRVAFQIAQRLKVGPKQVGDAATKLKVKIVECQLGCFT